MPQRRRNSCSRNVSTAAPETSRHLHRKGASRALPGFPGRFCPCAGNSVEHSPSVENRYKKISEALQSFWAAQNHEAGSFVSMAVQHSFCYHSESGPPAQSSRRFPEARCTRATCRHRNKLLLSAVIRQGMRCAEMRPVSLPALGVTSKWRVQKELHSVFTVFLSLSRWKLVLPHDCVSELGSASTLIRRRSLQETAACNQARTLQQRYSLTISRGPR